MAARFRIGEAYDARVEDGGGELTLIWSGDGKVLGATALHSRAPEDLRRLAAEIERARSGQAGMAL